MRAQALCLLAARTAAFVTVDRHSPYEQLAPACGRSVVFRTNGSDSADFVVTLPVASPVDGSRHAYAKPVLHGVNATCASLVPVRTLALRNPATCGARDCMYQDADGLRRVYELTLRGAMYPYWSGVDWIVWTDDTGGRANATVRRASSALRDGMARAVDLSVDTGMRIANAVAVRVLQRS